MNWKQILTAALLLPSLALGSGPGSDGGGNSALDPGTGQRRLLDLIEKDEVEYFKFILRYHHPEISHGTHANCVGDIEFCYITQIAERGESSFTHPKLHAAKLAKELRWAFTEENLQDVNDTGIIRIVNPKSKIQLAVQKNGFVLVNKPEFQSLDAESRAALKLHEAALYAVKLLNPELLDEKGTEPVRTYVRRWVKYITNPAQYPKDAVEEAYAALGVREKIKEMQQIEATPVPNGLILQMKHSLPLPERGKNFCIANFGKCYDLSEDIPNATNRIPAGSSFQPACVLEGIDGRKNNSITYEIKRVTEKPAYGKNSWSDLLSMRDKASEIELETSTGKTAKITCLNPGSPSRSIDYGDFKNIFSSYFSIKEKSQEQRRVFNESHDDESSEQRYSSGK